MGFSKPVNIIMTEATDLTPILNQINVVNDNAVQAAQNAEQAYNMAAEAEARATEAKTAATNANTNAAAAKTAATNANTAATAAKTAAQNAGFTGAIGYTGTYGQLSSDSALTLGEWTGKGRATITFAINQNEFSRFKPKVTIDGVVSALCNGSNAIFANNVDLYTAKVPIISSYYGSTAFGQMVVDFDTSLKIEHTANNNFSSGDGAISVGIELK